MRDEDGRWDIHASGLAAEGAQWGAALPRWHAIVPGGDGTDFRKNIGGADIAIAETKNVIPNDAFAVCSIRFNGDF